MKFERLQALIEEIKQLPFRKEKEDNIFSIGARGHYENAVSDLLAFFIDPSASHGMGDQVLQALLSCLAEDLDITGTHLTKPPARESANHEGKRIDLLLESEHWVMLIENKIYHHINNPLDSYKAWADERFKDKQVIYLIISIDGESPDKNWIGIEWQQYLKALKAALAESFVDSPLNKWPILFREYLLHLETLVSPTQYTYEEKCFVLNNLGEIQKINELKSNVIADFQEDIRKQIECEFESEATATTHNWGGFPALRFRLNRWKTQSDLVLYLADNNVDINVHAHTANHPKAEVSARKLIPSNDTWTESHNTFIGFRFKLTDFDPDALTEAVIAKAKLLDGYEKDNLDLIAD